MAIMKMGTHSKSCISAWYISDTGGTSETIADEAYAGAIQYFEQELTGDPKKTEWIKSQQDSMTSLLEVVEAAKYEYSTKGGDINNKAKKWVNLFSSRITYYGAVFDALAQHHPEYVALAWGAMKFIMIGVLNHAEMIVKLSKALSKIGEVLPLIKLGIELYPTKYMREAVCRVYAHIMLFLQKAAKWYGMSSARRMLAAVGNPFALSYEDTVEQIVSCTEYVNSVANAGSRAETRGLTFMIEQQDQRLQQMREQLNILTQKAHESENQISQLLQIATLTKPIIQDTFFEVGNQGKLVREMYSVDVLNILKPLRAPDDVLFTCQSIANGRKLWNQPAQDKISYARALDLWLSVLESSLFLVQAGPGAETTTKDLAVEVATLLKDNLYDLVWYISERLNDDQNYDLIDILKNLIFQLLQKHPEILISDPGSFLTTKLLSQKSEQEWIDLLYFVLAKLPRCFIIIETESIYGRKDRNSSWSTTLSTIFKQAVTNAKRGGNILKILLVTYDTLRAPITETAGPGQLTAYIRSTPLNLPKARRTIGRHHRIFKVSKHPLSLKKQ